MPKAHTRDRRRIRPFHLYNQGFKLDGCRPRKVFLDDEDRRYFLALLARHLGEVPRRDSRKRAFRHLRPLITLLAFCLMSTHFHLIVWQRDPAGIATLMNSVTSSYTRYFNAKYGNTQPLFCGPLCAKPIETRKYFRWLVGYVHDNHPSGLDYEFSSHRAWTDREQLPDWLDPAPALAVFGGVEGYRSYLDSRRRKQALDRELGFGRA